MRTATAIAFGLSFAIAEFGISLSGALAQIDVPDPGPGTCVAYCNGSSPSNDRERPEPPDPPDDSSERWQNAHAFYVKGAAAFDSGDYFAAANYFHLANNAYQSSAYEESEQAADAMIEVLRGKNLFAAGKFGGAIQAYQNALKMAPPDQDTAWLRNAIDACRASQLNVEGNQYFGVKDWDSAISRYDEALRILPGNAVLTRNRNLALSNKLVSEGDRFWDANNFDAATDRYQSALMASPGSKTASYKLASAAAVKANNQGIQYLDARDWDSAVRSFDDAVRLYPGGDDEKRLVLTNNLKRAEVHQLDVRISQTRRQLSQIAFRGGQLSADVDEWAAIGEGARTEALQKSLEEAKLSLVEVTMDAVLHYAKAAREAQAALDEKDIARWRGFWPSATGSPMQRLLADAIVHRDKMKVESDVVGFMQEYALNVTVAGVKVHDVVVDHKMAVKWGEMLMAGGEIFVADPRAKAAIKAAKFGAPVLYGYVASFAMHQQLEDLDSLTEEQYRDATRLTCQYLRDIQARKDLLGGTSSGVTCSTGS